jgi:hypothetical protein
MADAYDCGISGVTLSKPWGGCGIPIGWLAAQDLELLEWIQDWQYFGTACPSRASELQAIMCLRASDIILERSLTIIRHNKTLLERFMKEHRDCLRGFRPRREPLPQSVSKDHSPPEHSSLLPRAWLALPQAGLLVLYVATNCQVTLQPWPQEK